MVPVLLMRNIPAATQRLDQLHAGGHLLHPQIHRRALIVQQRGLRNDDVEVAVNAEFVAVAREIQISL